MNQTRFQEAISRIDAANAADPRGQEVPYAERLSAWVERLYPTAAEPLRLAVCWALAERQVARVRVALTPTVLGHVRCARPTTRALL